MKQLYCIVFFAVVLLQTGCKKELPSPIDFSKITVTDSSCLYISDVDATDWGYDAAWLTTEHALLQFNDSVRVTDSLTGYILVSAPCPNPNQGVFSMSVNTERDCMMRIACVNNQMEMLYYSVKRMTGGPITTTFDFSSNSAFHKDESYRLYYGFYNSRDSLYYKGHGDFRIE